MISIREMSSKDLVEVNSVFTKAFTSARVEEGLKHSRVSPCRLEFLKMYLDRAAEGALVAVDRDRIAGFNFNHMYGLTGWMGPLAVSPKYQNAGVGKALVLQGFDYLKARGVQIIGLETMPRNFRNIGFYLRLGFEVGPLCVDMVSPVYPGGSSGSAGGGKLIYFNECSETARGEILSGVAEISEATAPGLDYRGEVLLNMKHEFGDTVMLLDGNDVTAFAVCHIEPYGQFEDRRELKVNVLAVKPHNLPTASKVDDGEPSEESLARLTALLSGVKALASRENLSAVRVHPRTDKGGALRKLLSLDFKVAYSDLRMWISGFAEREPASYLHFCRWQ